MKYRYMSAKELLLTGVTGFAILGLAGPALAQSSGETTSVGRDEIIVTARKREESLQEYAGAITAITAESLQTNQINNLQDIRDLVPNLYIEEALGGATTPKIFVRGIGIDNPDSSFDSPVGIYIDGVYMARAFGALTDLYDIEQVEFLRGPQGTIYGRNNSAGALRVITKKPSLDTVEAGASIGFGTKSQFNAKGFISVPLVQDKLGFRASLNRRGNDGFMTDFVTGTKLKKDDLWTGRAALLYSANAQWDITARADFQDNSGVGSGASTVAPAFDVDGDIYTVHGQLIPLNQLTVVGTSIEANYSGSNFDFTSITAYRTIQMRNSGGDADGTPLSLLEGALQNMDENQFTQEAFITASSDASGMNVDWTAGVFYFHENIKDTRSFNVFPAIFGPASTQTIHQNIDAFAVYGEADFSVSDRLTLTAGGRFTTDSKDVDLLSLDNTRTTSFAVNEGIEVDKVTWKLVADYAVSDDLFLYASAGTGFRSGGVGFNPAARSAANIVNDIFGPEESLSFEAGFKKTFAGGRAQLNATYFYVEYTSLQLAAAGAGGIVVNTPDATNHGLEVELSAQLTDHLSLSGTLGTQFDEIKLSTNVLKNTPEFQGRVGLTYTNALPGNMGNITLAGDISYTTEYFVNTANTLLVGDHPLVNAMARWDAPEGNWGISITGKNITDEYYPTLGFKIIPGLLDNEFPNNPARWLAEIHVSY